MKKPLITIGITCYNSSNTIRRTINSAIKQKWKNKEIVIIDDSSTDESFAIIKNLQKKNKKIKIFKNSENKGLAYSMNKIIKKSKGEYLAFFDSDDFSISSRLDEQYKKFKREEKKNNIDKILIYSNRKFITINKRKITRYAIGRKEITPKGKIVAEYILNVIFNKSRFTWGMFGSCTLFTKKKNFFDVNLFDENFRRCAELDFAIRAAKKNFIFSSVNKVLINQFETIGSYKSLTHDFKNRLKLINKHESFLKNRSLFLSSYMNTIAWYFFTKKQNFIGYFFRSFSFFFAIKYFLTINSND